jgi:AcrR family transcriptional regulator
MPPTDPSTTPTRTRRPRADGERSRAAILRAAADLASVVGLEGLSIGALAEHLGVSKSGVFAHFRSKEELELATIETAEAIFAEEVVRPALAAPPGLARLRTLAERFLDHVERRTFPGGCFFAAAAAEFDARTGRVRDRVTRFVRGWSDTVRRLVDEAKGLGEIAPHVETAQLAFEVSALLNYGNDAFVLTADPRPLKQARAGIESALRRAVPVRSLRGRRRRR